MIPRLIHFVWIGPPRPAWVVRNIAEFERLNPAYEVRVHGEDVLWEPWGPTSGRCRDICTKADLLALSALRRFGGWRFDTDFWPFRPVSGIVNAYALDGGRMFVTEQHGQADPTLDTANGVMACTADWSGWPLIDRAVAARAPDVNDEPIQRCDFGPVLFSGLRRQWPEHFVRAAWPWFYPVARDLAETLYPALVRFGPALARQVCPAFDEVPFMMHLWAGGSTDRFEVEAEP